MALLVTGSTECGICGQVIAEGDQVFATWGVWPVRRQLAELCDSPLHWSCYAVWPHRREFARSYFDAWARRDPHATPWVEVYRDDRVLMTVNPSLGERGHAWLVLAETGSRLAVPLRDWERWVHDPTPDPDGSLHPLEATELHAVAPRLKAAWSDRRALLAAAERRRPR